MATPATGEEKTLVTAGMVCMVLLPPIGLVIGILLLTKPGRVEDGLLISIVALAVLTLGFFALT